MSKVIVYLMRNVGELVNLIEAALRLAGSIVSLTPTLKDDSVVESIKKGFKKLKEVFNIM